MPPTTPQAPQSGLDPDAVNLTKAIRQEESGGNATEEGKSGEYGAYQWEPATWDSMSKAAGVDVPLKQATLQQQNQVAYTQVKQWKDQGYNVGQIASMWNAGAGDPNAYLEDHKGTNAEGVSYDTPTYAKNVATYYQQYKTQGGQGSYPAPGTSQNTQTPVQGYAPPTPPMTSATPSAAAEPDQSGGAISQIGQDLSQGNISGAAGTAIKGLGNFLFPIAGDVKNDITGQNQKTALQQAGDLGTSALGVASLIPGADLIADPLEAARGADLAAEGATAAAKTGGLLSSNVAKNAALGAGLGATQAVGAGQTDPTKIAESAAGGGVTGGLIGGVASGLSKIADILPQRIVQSVLKNANPEVAQYALSKGVGSLGKMLTDSEGSIDTLGGQLGDSLEKAGVSGTKVNGNDFLGAIQSQYPNAEITQESLTGELKKLAGTQKGLVTKLFSDEGISYADLNKLKSSIGNSTFKSVLDTPETKTGKELGNAFYQAAKQKIIGAAPETEGVFDQLSKEYSLNKSLNKAIKVHSKTKLVNLKDLLFMAGGFAAHGPIGAAAGYLGEKAASSPTVNMGVAGLLNKAAGSGIQRAALPATAATAGLIGKTLGG